MNKEMSLDVALDIIGTLRMMKIDEISEEKDEKQKKKNTAKRTFCSQHRRKNSKWIVAV